MQDWFFRRHEAGKNPYVEAVRKIAAEEGAEVVVICAEIEAEMAELDDEERSMFLELMQQIYSANQFRKKAFALQDEHARSAKALWFLPLNIK